MLLLIRCWGVLIIFQKFRCKEYLSISKLVYISIIVLNWRMIWHCYCSLDRWPQTKCRVTFDTSFWYSFYALFLVSCILFCRAAPIIAYSDWLLKNYNQQENGWKSYHKKRNHKQVTKLTFHCLGSLIEKTNSGVKLANTGQKLKASIHIFTLCLPFSKNQPFWVSAPYISTLSNLPQGKHTTFTRFD